MGGQIKDSAAGKGKKDIKNTTAWNRRSQDTDYRKPLCCFQQEDDGCDCWRISGGADASASEADQKLNIEGVSAIQSPESILDPTRHQTPRCLQDNGKNNRGEVDCAMHGASGNKEIHSTQRTIHEVKLM